MQAALTFIAIAATLLFVWRARSKMEVKQQLTQVIPNSLLVAAGETALARQPSAIVLEPVATPEWKHQEQVTQLITETRAAGFADVGSYRTAALADVSMEFLLHADKRCYAVVYDSSRSEPWVNFIYRYEDGSSATYASSPARGMDRDPQHLLVQHPGFTPASLWEVAKSHHPHKPLKALSEVSILREFETAWQEQIEWRKAHPLSAGTIISVLNQHAAQHPAAAKPEVKLRLLEDLAGQPEFKAALSRLFEENPPVERAYLARAAHDDNRTTVVALCIASRDGQNAELLKALQQLCGEAGASLQSVVDILFVTKHQEDAMKRICSPFYNFETK